MVLFLKAEPNGKRLSEDLCLPIDGFLEKTEPQRRVPTTFIFVGDGLLTYGDAVRERLGESVHFADPIFNVPRGGNDCLPRCPTFTAGRD